MKYRQYKDWHISEIGYGLYGFSGAYGKVDQAAFEETICGAYERGVNLFDTAEGYGGAEEFLGKVVSPFRDQIYIATKLSGQSGVPDLSTHGVRKGCEASLKRLNTDVIDLYQIHFDDPNTPILETVTALEGLIEQGKIRQYGICHLSADKARQYAEIGDPFSILMELSPVACTAIKTLLPVCEDYDLAALAFSITGRGILTGRFEADHVFMPGDIRRMDPLFKRERFKSAQRVRKYLARLGDQYDRTALQMGIAWVLTQPKMVCALTGTSSIDHLEENLAASEIELEQNDTDALNRFLAEEERRLALKQEHTIKRILHEPLDEDPEQAFNDLIYILETAIQIGEVGETDVIPIFKELFSLRADVDQGARRKMQGIQVLLRQKILKN